MSSALTVVGAGPAAAAGCGAGFSDQGGGLCSTVLSATGSVQTLAVPAGVAHMTMVVAGGEGGMSLDQGTGSGSPGGLGGRETATVPVAPGDTLSVVVGQTGGVADLINPPTPPYGGGGVPGGAYAGYGGGGSFVFSSSALLIAAGGGGGGGYDYNPEASGQSRPQSAPGGAGAGAATAGDGASVAFCCDPTFPPPTHVAPGGGHGASTVAAGAGGTSVGANPGFGPSPGNAGQGPAADSSNLGVGGNGPASSGASGCFNSWAAGGGGGYFGGGSGGNMACDLEGGGGGGGSGYVVPGSTGTSAEIGVQASDGEVTISYVIGAVTVPDAPTGVTATAGNARATLHWTAPANGGSPLTGYVVTPLIGGVAQSAVTFNSTALTQLVTGLANGTAYTFRVAAKNAVGTGAQSVASAPVTPRSMTPASAFVRAAYADFLNRAPTPTELSTAAAAITAGTLTHNAFVTQLSSSTEWVGAVVQKLYQDTLGRPGDAGGVAYWVGRIQSHSLSVAKVAANFYASAEYYNGIGGGTDNSWLTDLYQKVLQRVADPAGLAYWKGQVTATGRVSVATRFYDSPESCRTRANNLYLKLLGRAGESGGLTYWAGRVRTDGDLALAANLASSAEYDQRAQSRFP